MYERTAVFILIVQIKTLIQFSLHDYNSFFITIIFGSKKESKLNYKKYKI